MSETKVLQKWEGVIDKYRDGDDIFHAHLYDLSGNVEEAAEIPLRLISEEEKPYIQKGAIFYWSLGYFKDVHGNKINFSEIEFKKDVWTPEEIATAKQEAKEIYENVIWK